MTYIKLEKIDLVDLQNSNSKELLRTNRSGSYSCTAISGCNTRKYHGLLVSPIEALGDSMAVLLSSLDVTVIQQEQEFNLGIHKYEGNYYAPRGHKYLREFKIEKLPKSTYRVGGVRLNLSKILIDTEERILISITLEEATSPTRIKLKPFLAFRNIHQLSKVNMDANTRVQPVPNGVKAKLYENYPELFMQTSIKSEFVHHPLWYNDIEYWEEQKRGYEYKEDLFVPGYFEMPIKKGQTIIFSASLKEETPKSFRSQFTAYAKKRIERNSYQDALVNSAQQFLEYKGKDKLYIKAGYPWYANIPRDTFISAPTLLMESGKKDEYLKLVETMLDELELDTGEIWQSKQVSIDAPLWLFISLRQYMEYNPKAKIWDKYGDKLKAILEAYRGNMLHHVAYNEENAMLYVFNKDIPLTWMNSNINGYPVVERYGYIVEVCSLWFNAISCAIDWARDEGDLDFLEKWHPLRRRMKETFPQIFMNENYSYLADYVTDRGQNFDVRPNQLIAVALPFTPVNREVVLNVTRIVESELLTPKGLRTLSPNHQKYSKIYKGNHEMREQQAHQGTVYPWLLSFYCQAYAKVHKKSVLSVFTKTYNALEPNIFEDGIGTLGEMFEADAPHKPRGAISMATSVASMLRINKLIENIEKKQKK